MNESRRSIWLLILILAVATALRLWALDGPALWWDEGNNAYFALQSPARVLEMSRLTHDTDPPAHRLALGLWLRVLGQSAWNLRLFSALLGVATVGLLFLWGRWYGGDRVGLLAALLMACSPLAVYYSREAKGYPFVAFFGLLALYLWMRYLQDARRFSIGYWVAYVLAGALAVGAHYYALFLFAAQGVGLALGLAFRGQGRRDALRPFLHWCIAQVVMVALLLSWVLPTYATALEGARNVTSAEQGSLTLLPYLKEVFLGFAAGPTARAYAALGTAAVLVAAAMTGIGHLGKRSLGAVLAVVLVPIALGFVAQRRYPFFSVRFLLYVLPAFYLLVAAGLVRLRRLALPLGVLLAAGWLVALPTAFLPFKGADEDIRPLARTLQERARPGDVVLVGYIWHEGILRMVAPDAPVRYLLGWYSAETVDAELSSLLRAYSRVWLVTYRAPLQHGEVNPAGWWLEQNTARVLATEHGHGRLVLYMPIPTGSGPSRSAEFEGGIRLTYWPISLSAAGSEPLAVTLGWEAIAPVDYDYTVFVHLIEREGETLWGQHDGQPTNALRSFTSLGPGQTITDCHVLWPQAGAPPGLYRLAVGLYRGDNGKRLRVTGGEQAGAERCMVGQVELCER